MQAVLWEADQPLVQCSTSHFYSLRWELIYWYFAIVFLRETLFFDDILLNNAFLFVFYGLYNMHGRKRYIIYIQVPRIHTWVILVHMTLRNGCCSHQQCE